MCDKYNYTVVVISKTIADEYFVKPRQKDRELFISKINKALLFHDEDYEGDKEYGSDNDEKFYDAENKETSHLRHLNNQITGTFSRWKCRSFIPLGEFIRRL
jgi:hypothetical protein